MTKAKIIELNIDSTEDIENLIVLDKNEVIDKGMILCILERLIQYEENLIFNIQTDMILDNNPLDFIEEEIETPYEQIIFHEGMSTALSNIYTLVEDEMFDIIESEEEDE